MISEAKACYGMASTYTWDSNYTKAQAMHGVDALNGVLRVDLLQKLMRYPQGISLSESQRELSGLTACDYRQKINTITQ